MVPPDPHPGRKTAPPFSPDGPTGRQASLAILPLAQVFGRVNLLEFEGWPRFLSLPLPPMWRCQVWLAPASQQLQEEEMETLHCHGASFSAKEQLIPETANRG